MVIGDLEDQGTDYRVEMKAVSIDVYTTTGVFAGLPPAGQVNTFKTFLL